MRRRAGWAYRLVLRLVAWWCGMHGLTVVDADALGEAARGCLDLVGFTQRSGHLTRAFHAGKVVRDAAWTVTQALARAGNAVWG